ncbi:DJ-1/PfpI family protein [Dehalobacter sp. DCM]|uniref:DJ-1/PfpI family protein n=1 Tax=Dehalobacter sp. DCM TaxID=2907827 RepID=UPI003081E467|nr:DJ-1/PfpI family protein [Dehalobacter sp. DCM]
MAKVLFVVAPQQFRDEELFYPREALEKCGHEISVASNKLGLCHGTLGGCVNADLLLKDAVAVDYDAVIFVGGGGSEVYFQDPDALKLAMKMVIDGKITAAICIAPVILANAGLLNGRKATVFESEINTIQNKGASYSGPGVAQDGNIITADSPNSALQFGEKLCEVLGAIH